MRLLRATRRRLTRTYHMWCAREDARRHGLIVPAGVWLCAHCPQVRFDAGLLRQHMSAQHLPT
jgi:hypothetical protein